MATECNALSSLTESVNANPSTVSSCPQRLVLRIIGKMDVSWGRKPFSAVASARGQWRHVMFIAGLPGLCRVNMLAAIDVAGVKSRGGRCWFELADHREA